MIYPLTSLFHYPFLIFLFKGPQVGVVDLTRPGPVAVECTADADEARCLTAATLVSVLCARTVWKVRPYSSHSEDSNRGVVMNNFNKELFKHPKRANKKLACDCIGENYYFSFSV